MTRQQHAILHPPGLHAVPMQTESAMARSRTPTEGEEDVICHISSVTCDA